MDLDATVATGRRRVDRSSFYLRTARNVQNLSTIGPSFLPALRLIGRLAPASTRWRTEKH
jgi:hypothetical protein